MGTNFYFFTRIKANAEKTAPISYKLVDEPDFGYEIHLAKTSAGWLPLFDSNYNHIKSVKQMKEIYESGDFEIYDEYGDKYNWEEFDKRVLQHNGGVKGAIPVTHYDKGSPNDRYYDPDMPDHTPVSHFEYGNGKYNSLYFADEEGYEFSNDFS